MPLILDHGLGEKVWTMDFANDRLGSEHHHERSL